MRPLLSLLVSLVLSFVCAFPAQAAIFSTVRDTTADWDDFLVYQTLMEDGFESVAAVSFVGDGLQLARVGGVFLFEEVPYWPFANLSEFAAMPMHFAFFSDFAEFEADPLNGQEIAGPVNPGWQDPLPGSDGVFYLEWDVLSLGIQTVAGQEHFAAFTPLPTPVTTDFVDVYLLGADLEDGPTDWGFFKVTEPVGPFPLEDYYYPSSSGAVFVQTLVPEPSTFLTMFAAGLLGAFALTGRRRR